MKPLLLNKKSWHYEIAKFAGFSSSDGHDNMCDYSRSLVLGILLGSFLTFAAAALEVALIEGFMGIAFSLYYWQMMFSDIGVIGACVIVLALVLTIIGCLVYVADKRRTARYERVRNGEPAPEPGFIVHAYRGWKEKYCIPIEFKS